MFMNGDTTAMGLILETRRDVAWIRETLEEIKRSNMILERRIANLEHQQSKWIGRDGAIAALISATVAVLTILVAVAFR